MHMENSLSRILIETTVRQTLKGLQENPKRSIRNVVDMALQFSEGRFQSRFFETAQELLKMRAVPIIPWYRMPPAILKRSIW